MYVLNYDVGSINNVNVSNKCKRLSSTNETYFWHIRLGHINLNEIQTLVKDVPLSELKVKSLSVCKSYLEGKKTTSPFTSKGLRAKEVLELVYVDVCGPISVRARGKYEYFITFNYNYSRYVYVYLMACKSAPLKSSRNSRSE